MPLTVLLNRLIEHDNLTAAEAEEAMHLVLSGAVPAPMLAGFLIALRMRGETADELLGFARAMRQHVQKVPVTAPGPLLDTCGTGGDGGRTFNISTVTAFVVAGAGVRVAKHGNRSATSLCGSADILEELGVHLQLTPEQVGRCIDDVGIGFLFAQALHTAMRHAAEARKALRIRTAFNLLGPLTNPAGATCQLIGAPSERAAGLLADALAQLGLEHGFVVHGADGLDEVTLTGATAYWEIADGQVRRGSWQPGDFGLPAATVEELAGGDRVANAAIARAILDGEPGARRNIVLANAAAALLAAGAVTRLQDGVAIGAEAIDSGKAAQKLLRLIEQSRGLAATSAAG